MRVVASLFCGVLASVVLGASVASAQAASCYDGRQNGPESDVDCGGDCVACEIGLRCVVARDCASGRCVSGECAEQAWRTGDAIPPGYHVEVSMTDAAATARRAGLVFFAISYSGAYVGALVLPQRLSWLYAPVVGPFAALQEDDLGGLVRALLVADGALQAAGAGLLIGGIIGRGQQLVRGEQPTSSKRPTVEVAATPTIAGGGVGLSCFGSF